MKVLFIFALVSATNAFSSSLKDEFGPLPGSGLVAEWNCPRTDVVAWCEVASVETVQADLDLFIKESNRRIELMKSRLDYLKASYDEIHKLISVKATNSNYYDYYSKVAKYLEEQIGGKHPVYTEVKSLGKDSEVVKKLQEYIYIFNSYERRIDEAPTEAYKQSLILDRNIELGVLAKYFHNMQDTFKSISKKYFGENNNAIQDIVFNERNGLSVNEYLMWSNCYSHELYVFKNINLHKKASSSSFALIEEAPYIRVVLDGVNAVGPLTFECRWSPTHKEGYDVKRNVFRSNYLVGDTADVYQRFPLLGFQEIQENLRTVLKPYLK